MFGFRFLKAYPTTYIIQYRGGAVVREGQALSFWYFAPVTTIVAIPSGSVDVPFILKDISADYQEVTVQGSFAYRITDPKTVSTRLNFSVRQVAGRLEHVSDDPDKMATRITNFVQVLTRAEIQKRTLTQCLAEADQISASALSALKESANLAGLGVEVISFSVLAIKPTPETAKALEAEVRETLLRHADDAIYVRRNSAIDNERTIKENELQTQLSVTQRQREIKEKEMETLIAVEEQRKKLVQVKTENMRQEADAREYATTAAVRPLAAMDPKTLEILASANMEPKLLISAAFKQLAENAGSIGTLNITPDLLESLLDTRAAKPTRVPDK